MKKIIAVDFDGTLCENKYPEIGELRRDVLDRLWEEQIKGARLILWTCRRDDLLEDAVLWCKYRGIFFDAVNENLLNVIDEFGSDTRKIFADEYWDDGAVKV